MPETIRDNFVSSEKKQYKIGFGKALATSLSGFLAGLIVASIIFFSFFELSLK